MLERLKHYYDDERIIFVVSINKEQLVHTITKYYGDGFDSTGYLNKFFDLNIHMSSNKHTNNKLYDSKQYHLKIMAEELSAYYEFSLRESLIFQHKISKLPSDIVHDYSVQGCCLSIFIPLILALDLKCEEEKARFINGKSDILGILVQELPELRRILCRFSQDEQYSIGLEKLQELYKYAFGDKKMSDYNQLKLDVSADIGKVCINLCNGF